MEGKVGQLSDIGQFIKPGSSVAIGGAWLCNHPMAIVREIIRQQIKDLTVMTIVGSIDIDLLLGAGLVKELYFSFVSLEAFGLAPNFRRAIEGQQIAFQEISGLAMILGFEATGRGVSFLPYGGPVGSDYLKMRPDFYKMIKCPFTGQDLVAVPALKPDVAIIHAQKADLEGNIQIEGTSGSDVDLAKAADKVIVTVEQIVSSEQIRAEAAKTKIPRFYVDLVIHAPLGAHPTSCVPEYVMDAWHVMEYMKLAQKPESFQQYVQRYITGSSEEEYLELLGAEKRSKLKKLVGEARLLS
ncbi:MAG: CoA transferase subunit A [Chloroflexota bacterium]|nr:MAG: CoA transferase subunit A [Chloroflexota bacterium]